jgi:antitoxin component YwqK of YwqJK toxin-antitoxin module
MTTILSLDSLPKDVLDLITRDTTLASWLSMRLTCKRLWTLCSLDRYRTQFVKRLTGERCVYFILPNGLRHGEYMTYYDASYHTKCASASYKDGHLDGEAYGWYCDGMLEHTLTYKNGKLEGPCLMWYPNGQLKRRYSCVNSEYDEEYVEWYANEQPRKSCTYKRGVREGLYEHWDSYGNLTVRAWYERGKRVSLK